MTGNTFRLPGFLADINVGCKIAIKRQRLAEIIPGFADYETIGTVDAYATSQGMLAPSMTVTLTDPAYSGCHSPNTHIEFILPVIRVDTVGMCVGRMDDPKLICKTCFRKNDAFIEEFAQKDLEPDDACTRCGKVLGANAA